MALTCNTQSIVVSNRLDLVLELRPPFVRPLVATDPTVGCTRPRQLLPPLHTDYLRMYLVRELGWIPCVSY